MSPLCRRPQNTIPFPLDFNRLGHSLGRMLNSEVDIGRRAHNPTIIYRHQAGQAPDHHPSSLVSTSQPSVVMHICRS